MVMDEGRFGRISDPQPAWAPPGVRPVAPQQRVRESLYAFTAVAPVQGRMSSLIVPEANKAMMELFLAQLSQEFADEVVVLQVDGAKWHTSPNLQIPDNIRLIVQPAYSPQLNAVEHIWDDLREHEFANRAYDSLDEVKQALGDGLRRLAALPAKLRSMTFFPHLRAAWMHLTGVQQCGA